MPSQGTLPGMHVATALRLLPSPANPGTRVSRVRGAGTGRRRAGPRWTGSGARVAGP